MSVEDTLHLALAETKSKKAKRRIRVKVVGPRPFVVYFETPGEFIVTVTSKVGLKHSWKIQL